MITSCCSLLPPLSSLQTINRTINSATSSSNLPSRNNLSLQIQIDARTKNSIQSTARRPRLWQRPRPAIMRTDRRAQGAWRSRGVAWQET